MLGSSGNTTGSAARGVFIVLAGARSIPKKRVAGEPMLLGLRQADGFLKVLKADLPFQEQTCVFSRLNHSEVSKFLSCQKIHHGGNDFIYCLFFRGAWLRNCWKSVWAMWKERLHKNSNVLLPRLGHFAQSMVWKCTVDQASWCSLICLIKSPKLLSSCPEKWWVLVTSGPSLRRDD